ncbi:hypothetical protein ABZ464_24465 [Streptomyces sp. NPDC005820]|uniref:hypothetical protein n=1 Tax=Streptomyces sp. NPDC005820 TaxID=3157069 RepID=UPI0033E06FD4
MIRYAPTGDPDIGTTGADPTKETVALSEGGATVEKQTLTCWDSSDDTFSLRIRQAE